MAKIMETSRTGKTSAAFRKLAIISNRNPSPHLEIRQTEHLLSEHSHNFVVQIERTGRAAHRAEKGSIDTPSGSRRLVYTLRDATIIQLCSHYDTRGTRSSKRNQTPC